MAYEIGSLAATTGVTPSSWTQSNFTISGYLTSPVQIFAYGGTNPQLSAGSGFVAGGDGVTLPSGPTLQGVSVIHDADSQSGTTSHTTVLVDTTCIVFSSTTSGTASVDRTPNAFSLAAVTNAATSTVRQSAVATPTGYAGAASVAVRGSGNPQVQIAGGEWAYAGSISPGQTVRVRHTTADTVGASVSTDLLIGDTVVTFTTTTGANGGDGGGDTGGTPDPILPPAAIPADSAPLRSSLQALVQDPLVTLFEIDFTTMPGYSAETNGPAILRYSAYKNGASLISYGGNQYEYVSLEMTGVSAELGGRMPEPRLSIFSPDQSFRSAFAIYGSDFRGAKLRRIRIYARFLDSGSSPSTADALVDEYYIDRLEKFTKLEAIFVAAISQGVDRLGSSGTRGVSTNLCSLIYRQCQQNTPGGFDYKPPADGGCPWGQTQPWGNKETTGTPYFNGLNEEVTDWKQDMCPKTWTACIKRFDPTASGTIPIPHTSTPRVKTTNTTGTCS